MLFLKFEIYYTHVFLYITPLRIKNTVVLHGYILTTFIWFKIDLNKNLVFFHQINND